MIARRRSPLPVCVFGSVLPLVAALAAHAQSGAEPPVHHLRAATAAADAPEDPEALRKLVVKIVENAGKTSYTFTREPPGAAAQSNHYTESTTGAYVDLEKCTFDRTYTTQVDDKQPYDDRTFVRLWEVRKVRFGESNELRQQWETSFRAQHPENDLPKTHFKFEPGYPAVYFVLDDDSYRQVPVATEEDGRRLERSLEHAVAVCGGPGATKAAAERAEAASKDLETTRRFIADTLNNEGKISYTTSVQDTKNKNNWDNQWTYQVSDPNVNFGGCYFSWKEVRYHDNQDSKAHEWWFKLGAIEDVMVGSVDDAMKEVDTNQGHPEFNELTSPPVSAVIIRSPKGEFSFLLFHSDAVAGRMRKAFKHAAELCGGMGGGSPF